MTLIINRREKIETLLQNERKAMKLMKHQLSLRNEFYQTLKDVPPYEIVETEIKENADLIENEDYLIIGSDVYIRLKAALYLIGRFAVTNTNGFTEYIKYLAKEEKKVFSGYNDERLPGLNSTEQEWNDYMLPTIQSNAKFLGMEKNAFLAKVYKEMHVNFSKYTGEYLERIHMPDVSRISKFRVVTCTPILRAKFEKAMSVVMVNHKYKERG